MNISQGLISALHKSTSIAVLTGAGVSQESGLRTFRDSQTGLWSQYKPEELASPDAFARDPKLVWDWYAMRREKIRTVLPNPGHTALAEMEQHFPVFVIITQNVDGLHQKAGSVNVIELHGNLQRVKCSLCGMKVSEWSETKEDVPACQICGGLLRPDVIWFGEALPRAALEEAVLTCRNCDLFFSIGTSGIVQPAASLAYAARNNGAALVEINTERTSLTTKVDFALLGKSGEILPALLKAAL